MKYWGLASIGVWLLGAVLAGAQTPSDAAGADAAVMDEFALDESQATVITSTRLTFDQQQLFALFEENVVVTDPALKMTADRLRVVFTEDNQAESIEADGNVVITQEGTTAWAGKATYDVASGQILLEQSPRIRRGRDLLEGETITFWRDDNRMVCEPRARLVLFPNDGDSGASAGDILFGE